MSVVNRGHFDKNAVRDLVSYTSMIALSVLVFGTVWYLRSKFRRLLELGAMREPMNNTSSNQNQQRWLAMQQQQYPNGMIPRCNNTRRATIQMPPQMPSTPMNTVSGQNSVDSPPSYFSVVYTDIFSPKKQKGRNSNSHEGFTASPPSYISSFVVKPAPKAEDGV